MHKLQHLARRLALALALAVLLTAVMPVTAQAAESTESNWIELLETATVNDSGNNLIQLNSTSGTFRIKTPLYMRCTKVDLILTHPSGYTPSSVKLRYNNTYYTLTLVKIDNYTTRAYGANIPNNLYADLVLQINKSNTDLINYQLLSCRVTSLENSEFPATAYAYIDGTNYNTPFAFENPGDTVNGSEAFGHYQFPVIVTDWQKYDKITISGSVGTMALNSVRCTIGGLGLPYDISYTASNPTGSEADYIAWNEWKYYSYNESYQGTTDGTIFSYDSYLGKTLFTITIDLTGVDRTSTNNLYCYFTTLASDWYGYTVQVMEVIGSIDVADTTEVTWWTRFTAFMSDLFGGDSTEADEYASEMESQSQEMQDAVDQMEQVTKPAVDDLDVSVDAYVDPVGVQQAGEVMGQFLGNSLILSMVCISLTVSLVAFVIFGKR